MIGAPALAFEGVRLQQGGAPRISRDMMRTTMDTNPLQEDLGVRSDVEAVLALVDVEGLGIVDVGCGPGRTTRDLHAAGARVLGVEPDPIQAAENRKISPPEGLAFGEARAESLPVADGSVDGVIFFRSLHHVPIESMERAIEEAVRALKPEAGFLCVVEPAMDGTHFPVMRSFNDETTVRREAQAALNCFASPRFRERTSYRYRQFPRYADFEAFVARVTGRTYIDICREKVETDEVRRLFEAGRSEAGDYVFEQPMRLDLFRCPAKG